MCNFITNFVRIFGTGKDFSKNHVTAFLGDGSIVPKFSDLKVVAILLYWQNQKGWPPISLAYKCFRKRIEIIFS